MKTTPLRVAYFTIQYPTLSQTFLQREVETLRAQGIDVRIYPCWQWGRQPAGESAFAHPTVPVDPPGLANSWALPWHVTTQALAMGRDWKKALALLRTHPPRTFEGRFMTYWGACYGLHLAGRFRQQPPDHFHGAWATGPATIAGLLARRFTRPFSFGAHAYDVFRDGGDPLLDAKLRAAAFVHTTTRQTEAYLRSRVPDAPIVLSRRGLPELPEFRPPGPAHEPIRILSVGRLVEKKGHTHQLAACEELARRGEQVRLRIVGEGPLGEPLACEVEARGLGERVEFTGGQPAEKVREHYRWADLFWHTGIVDAEGDRDGLPNVVPEAMAHGLPVIACTEAGVTEAIEDGETGLTVEVRDTAKLADTVMKIARDLPLRQRLAENARHWVETHFVSETNTALLADAFQRAQS